jgi:NAD dependent epimerase/dehydratase family enzyme
MKIVIPGGSGQVGTILARAYHDLGHEVVILSRNTLRAPCALSFGMLRGWGRGPRKLMGLML